MKGISRGSRAIGLFLLAIGLMVLLNPVVFAQEEFEIHVFYGQGCPYCAKLESFLDDVKEDHPNMEMVMREVYSDQENRVLLQDFCNRFDAQIEGVPTTFINGHMYTGFNNQIKEEILKDIEYCSENGCDVFEGHQSCDDYEDPIIDDSNPISPSVNSKHVLVGWGVIGIILVLVVYFVFRRFKK